MGRETKAGCGGGGCVWEEGLAGDCVGMGVGGRGDMTGANDSDDDYNKETGE